MSQNISLLNAVYSNVPAVQLPKQGGGTARFDDVSVTTATAEDVASGKVFVASDGTITTGTASVGGGSVTQDEDGFIILPPDGGGSGGGGLVYEEGVFAPTVDIHNPTIYFSDTHAERPIFVVMSDAGETAPPDSSNLMWSMVNYGTFNGTIASGTYNAVMCYLHMSYGNPSLTSVNIATYSGWLTESSFYAYTQSSGRYWRAGRTYKWIAAWKP